MKQAQLQQLLAEVTITITTKNRWHDLRRLFEMFRELGLDGVETILVDDGSDEALGEQVSQGLTRCRVLRFEQSAGLVERRNQMVKLATTRYALSLDDDSCVLNVDDLARAIEYMDREERIAVLAFPVLETTERPAKSPSVLDREPVVPVKDFVGCGHLLRRDAFLEAGGYRAFLQFMCEERDLSMRLYGRGYEVVFFPSCPVMHWCSPSGRNIQRMNYFRARNVTAIFLLNAPGHWSWIYAVATAARLVGFALMRNQYPLATVKGFAAGLAMYWRRRQEATRISNKAFHKWVNVANATRLFPAVEG